MGLLAAGLTGACADTTVKTGKLREKKLHVALDVALLHQADVPAATPARLHVTQQQRSTHWQHALQRRLPFGIHANNPVHGGP